MKSDKNAANGCIVKVLFMVQGLLLMTIALFPHFAKMCDNSIVGGCHESWFILVFGVIHVIGGIVSFFTHCLNESSPCTTLICCVMIHIAPVGLVLYHGYKFVKLLETQNTSSEIVTFSMPFVWIVCAFYVMLSIVQITNQVIIIVWNKYSMSDKNATCVTEKQNDHWPLCKIEGAVCKINMDKAISISRRDKK